MAVVHSAHVVEPGTILLGKYRIERILGKGGMGVVALAHHLHLDEPMAIKFLQAGALEKPEIARRFQREARAAVKLKSEHVCSVFDVGELPDGSPYMVMEYLQGMDLHGFLGEHGPPPIAMTADIALQACQALAEAHALGIVHRDIKPANFFLTHRSDGSLLVKLLDFGISKATKDVDVDLTSTQTTLGTPAYMSPEQLRSSREVDTRTDIWSMGVVLYELLSGRRPYIATSFSALCLKVVMDPVPPLEVELPPGLEQVVLTCLEKDPGDRFQNVAQVAAAIEPFGREAGTGPSQSERAATVLGLASVDTGSASKFEPGMYTEQYAGQYAADPGVPSEVGAGTLTMTAGAGEMTASNSSSRKRPWLALGLASVVLVAGAVVAVLLAGGSDASDKSTAVIRSDTGAPVDAGPGRAADAAAEGMIAVKTGSDAGTAIDATVEVGRFRIESDPKGAALSLDGNPVGQTPFETELHHGESRTYQLTLRGFQDTSVSLPEAAGADGTVMVRLDRVRSRQKGTLVISVATWAEVFIDGKSFGQVPNKFRLPVGQHKVTLVNTSIGQKEHVKVDIEADKTVTIKRKW